MILIKGELLFRHSLPLSEKSGKKDKNHCKTVKVSLRHAYCFDATADFNSTAKKSYLAFGVIVCVIARG